MDALSNLPAPPQEAVKPLPDLIERIRTKLAGCAQSRESYLKHALDVATG
jgi:hypothetical protein